MNAYQRVLQEVLDKVKPADKQVGEELMQLGKSEEGISGPFFRLPIPPHLEQAYNLGKGAKLLPDMLKATGKASIQIFYPARIKPSQRWEEEAAKGKDLSNEFGRFAKKLTQKLPANVKVSVSPVYQMGQTRTGFGGLIGRASRTWLPEQIDINRPVAIIDEMMDSGGTFASIISAILGQGMEPQNILMVSSSDATLEQYGFALKPEDLKFIEEQGEAQNIRYNVMLNLLGLSGPKALSRNEFMRYFREPGNPKDVETLLIKEIKDSLGIPAISPEEIQLAKNKGILKSR